MIIDPDYPSTTFHAEANQYVLSAIARSHDGLTHRHIGEKSDTASPDQSTSEYLSPDEPPHSLPAGEDELAEVIGEALALLVEGVYEARIEAYEARKTRHGLKLYITLRIISAEQCAGQTITRYYNVKPPRTPRASGGGFALGARSDAYREFKELLGEDFRKDRLPAQRILGMHVLAQVVTVRSDHRGNELHPCNWYSKAQRLMRIPASSESIESTYNPCPSLNPCPPPSPNPSPSPSLKPNLKPTLHPILDDRQWAGISGET
jgi:hypothetical protein